MTISQLKAKNIAGDGHFFDRATLRQFGDTIKNFGIRKRPVKGSRVKGVWLFNSITGRMIKFLS